MNKYVFGGCSLLAAGAAVAFAHLAGSGRASARPHQPVPASVKRAPALEVRDWLAVGSGCRAVPNQPRNVSYELVPDRAHPGRYRAIIKLDTYGLFGDQPISPGEATFARECGIRFAVHPAQGVKLVGASARFEYAVERDQAAQVRMRGRLFVGKNQLAREEVWLRSGDPAAASRRFELAPGTGENAFPGLNCEQAKIVGLDLSMATVREQASQAVSVRLVDQKAEVTFDTAPCTPGDVKQP